MTYTYCWPLGAHLGGLTSSTPGNSASFKHKVRIVPKSHKARCALCKHTKQAASTRIEREKCRLLQNCFMSHVQVPFLWRESDPGANAKWQVSSAPDLPASSLICAKQRVCAKPEPNTRVHLPFLECCMQCSVCTIFYSHDWVTQSQ